MNREEVIAALDAVVDRNGELFKQARAKHADRPHDAVANYIAHELAPPVAEVLARQPEYVASPNLMMAQDRSSTSINPVQLAPRFVKLALHVGSTEAVDWLAKLLVTKRAVGFRVMPLWGINCDEHVTFTPGVSLIPFEDVPASAGKAWVENPEQRGPGAAHMLPGWQLSFEQPEAALVARIEIEPLIFQPNTPRNASDPLTLQTLLDDIRLCLVTSAESPVIGPISWFQYEDADFEPVSMDGIYGTHSEIMPIHLPSSKDLDLTCSQALTAEFLKLDEPTRNRVRTASQRLLHAMLRIGVGDKAVELSIALETLLGDAPGELGWKVSTRAAAISGWDMPSMLRRKSVVYALYSMRSRLMHEGSVGTEIKIAGQGKRPANEVCEEAIRICTFVVRAIIERRGLPNWHQFDLSGGEQGWPI